MELLKFDTGINREGQEFLVNPAIPQFAGMAHFAGTGPAGKTCRECVFWLHRNGWAREEGLGGGGEPHPARCQKHRQFSMKRRGPHIPHDAKSCKHFEQSDSPQPLKRPKKVYEQ